MAIFGTDYDASVAALRRNSDFQKIVASYTDLYHKTVEQLISSTEGADSRAVLVGRAQALRTILTSIERAVDNVKAHEDRK